MNGPFARVESRWIAAATSSLPVPLSPSISTGESVVATLPMISFTRCMGDALPTSSLTLSSSPRRARSDWTSPLRNLRSVTRAIRWRSSSRISGLDR